MRVEEKLKNGTPKAWNNETAETTEKAVRLFDNRTASYAVERPNCRF
jgi:hypothetical protein